MTRFEAAQALKAGKKLTHEYFSPDEWVKGNGYGDYFLEDGVVCSAAEFWKWRQQQFFNDGWKLFEETPKKTVRDETQPARVNKFHSDGDGGEFDDFGVPGIF